MAPSLPSGISFGTVVGQYIASVQDGPDEDYNPEAAALTGTIMFTPSAGYVQARSDTNAVTVLKTSTVGVLDSEGYLCTSQIDPETGQLRRGVNLIATNTSAMNPVGWNYTVTYNLMWNGVLIAGPRNHPLNVPAGGVIDLTDEAPVASSSGTVITRGERGPAGASAYEIAVANGYTGTQAQWISEIVSNGGYWSRAQTAPVVVIPANAPWPAEAPPGALVIRLA